MERPGVGVLLALVGMLLIPGCAQRAEEPQSPPGGTNTASEPRSEVGEAAREAGQAAEKAARGIGQAAENAVLTAKVKNALMITKGMNTSKVNVDTSKEGVVTLRGSVPTADMKRLAEKTAKNVAGVSGVKNALTVAAGTH